MEYEEIELIKQSEKSVVHLVREKGGEQFFVRKILKGYQPIYLLLQICAHPGLPKLYDVVMFNNTTTIIEEYIEGESLGSVDLSEKQFLNVVRELCSVLKYLHGKGIIHRDIKPSNIIFAADGHIRLIDFDAARMPKEDYNQDTRLLGTRGYAPPEQYGFEQTDARTDIYALGITLQQILGGKLQRPRYKRIIRKCTKLDPDRRYQSVRQMEKAFFHRDRTLFLCIIAIVFVACFNHYVIIPKLTKTESSQAEDDLAANQVASERYPNQVLWNNIPVNDYFGQYIEDVIEGGGTPLEQYTDEEEWGWCSYIGIVFLFDEQHKVYGLRLDASECTYNGAALDVDWETLPEILGEPHLSGQEEDSGKYYMTYFEHSYDGTRNYTIYFASSDGVAREIWVRKVS